MSVIVWYKNTNKEVKYINRIHYMPELLSDSERVGGVELESLPAPEDNGMLYRYYINPITHEVGIEYFNKPKDLNQQVTEFQEDLLVALEAIAEIYEQINGGAL